MQPERMIGSVSAWNNSTRAELELWRLESAGRTQEKEKERSVLLLVGSSVFISLCMRLAYF